jgi:hypothetical protein
VTENELAATAKDHRAVPEPGISTDSDSPTFRVSLGMNWSFWIFISMIVVHQKYRRSEQDVIFKDNFIAGGYCRPPTDFTSCPNEDLW